MRGAGRISLSSRPRSCGCGKDGRWAAGWCARTPGQVELARTRCDRPRSQGSRALPPHTADTTAHRARRAAGGGARSACCGSNRLPAGQDRRGGGGGGTGSPAPCRAALGSAQLAEGGEFLGHGHLSAPADRYPSRERSRREGTSPDTVPHGSSARRATGKRTRSASRPRMSAQSFACRQGASPGSRSPHLGWGDP